MRSFWSGAISFGLIHIPIKLYKATEERGLDFDLLRKKDMCPIGYEKVCKITGEKVSKDEIVRGYEYQKGDYVILKDDDIKKAFPKRTQTLEIVEFVDQNDIDAMYFEKPYYVEPEKGAEKVYALLREALKKSKKVGIARFVIRNLEHLAIIKPEKDLIILDQIRFPSEIRKPQDLRIPKNQEISEKELDMAIKLIDELSEPFIPEKLKDTYTEELKEVIEEKAKGKMVKPREETPPRIAEIEDIMAKLKQSLEHAKQKASATV